MHPLTEQQTETEKPPIDLYQKLTDTITGHMEAGNTPWQKSITAGEGIYPRMPVNIVSGKDYTGINTLLLWCAGLEQGFTSHEWAGFRQWKEREENIRKGEKGTLAVFYAASETEESNEPKKSVLKSYIVFNRCQLGSYKQEAETTGVALTLKQRLEGARAFVDNTHALILHKGKKAVYDAIKDEIHHPKPGAFKDSPPSSAAEHYYSSLFPELIRWTGHPQRLGRSFEQRFGEDAPIAEELTVAIGAVFLCAELGIRPALLKDRAATIQNWVATMQRNKYLVTAAATAAWKATNHLQQLQPKP
jgi:antirestriction protein ArdC